MQSTNQPPPTTANAALADALVPSWDVLRALETAHGESFYILDLDRFRANYLEFRDAFRKRYRATELAYSYKTNYTPSLGRAVDELGGYAEVVSAMEYDLAIMLGVVPERIILNGPYKPYNQLAAALMAGSIVNLDGQREVELLEQISRDAPDRTLRVGLRCNLDVDGELPSRFGFDVGQPEFRDTVRRLGRMVNVRLVGVHNHVSSARRSPASFARRVERLLALLIEEFPKGTPEFLNLGGGYFGKMSEPLRQQFPFPVAAYDDYAEAIAGAVV